MSNLCRALLIALSLGTVSLSYGQNPVLVDPAATECANPGWDARAQVYLPQCSPYALGTYPGNRCFVTIDRAAPTSPMAITLPPGTHACLALHHPRPTEGVQFQPTISNVAAPDLGSTFLPNLSPLQSLGFLAGQTQLPNLAAGPGGGVVAFALHGFQLDLQPDFDELDPPQRLEVLSVLASAGSPVNLTGSKLLVVETSDTTHTDELDAIVADLPDQEKKNLTAASSAVSSAHQFQAMDAGQRKSISDAFSAAVTTAFVGGDSKAQAAATSEVSLLSARLAGNVDELALANELFSLGRKDPPLLAAFNNIAVQVTAPLPVPRPLPPAALADIRTTLEPWLNALDAEVATATSAIVHAGNLAACFLQYSKLAPATSNPNSSGLIQFNGQESSPTAVATCSPQALTLQGDSLREAFQPIYDDVSKNSNIGLMQGEYTALNTIVADGLKQCAQTSETGMGIAPGLAGGGGKAASPLNPPDCAALTADNDKLSSIQSRITFLSSLQVPLQQVRIQLERLPQRMDDILYELPITGKFQRGYTSASVAVSVQPLVSLTPSPTASTIATVPITYGAGRWRTFSTSTGVAFLFGKAANYSLQQQATVVPTTQSGNLCTPVPSGTTAPSSTYCIVNSPSSSPQVLAPAVYLHYLLFGAKRAPFQVGVHLTGGVGLDLSAANKSATFMTGASLQLGSVMITPAVTFVEDQRLAGGYTPQQSYSSSGAVPTNTVWPKKFSIGITYVIPALSSASPASPASSPSSSSNSSTSSSSTGSGGGGKKPH